MLDAFMFLQELQRRGAINMLKKVPSYFKLPIDGQIAAGDPIEPMDTEHVLDLADSLLKANCYILKVVGDSMSGDNICDGDYVVCERRSEAENGEIVVAVINNRETTLKRFQRNPDKTVALIPSNPKLTPMTYPGDRVKVQGVYLGLIRLKDNK